MQDDEINPGDAHASPPTERRIPGRRDRKTQIVETNPIYPALVAANRENARKSTVQRTQDGKPPFICDTMLPCDSRMCGVRDTLTAMGRLNCESNQ